MIDLILLALLVAALAVYLVFMSLWWEEQTLRFRHFLILFGLIVVCLTQALSL